MKKLMAAGVGFISFCCGATVFDFTTVEYSDNRCPSGWSTDNPWYDTSYPSLGYASSENGLGLNFYYAQEALEMMLSRQIPIDDERICDNFVFEITAWVNPANAQGKVDRICPVISFDGSNFVPLGSEIALHDSNRNVAGWETFVFSSNIVDAVSKNIYIGVKSIAGGRSLSVSYIKSIKAGFKVCASVNEICLVSNGAIEQDPTNLLPGDTNLRVRAQINVSPNDVSKVCLLENGVVAKVIVNGNDPVDYIMTDGNDGYWYSDILPTMDAGSKLSVQVSTRYRSPAGLETLSNPDEEGIATESKTVDGFAVCKLGSVWINEITPNAVELCGTTNRVYVDNGWKLSISTNDVVAKVISLELSFNNDFKVSVDKTGGVVGFAVLKDVDFGVKAEEYPVTIRLINASDIEEDAVTLNYPVTVSFGRVNCAKFYGWDYDWEGTAAGSIFVWTNRERSTLGEINDGQGFRTPDEKKIVVKTVMVDSEETETPLAYATVEVNIEDYKNVESGTPAECLVKNVVTPSPDATTNVNVIGWSPSTNVLDVSVKATAFGWTSDKIQREILRTSSSEEFTISMNPAIAFDDFEAGLASYWNNNGSIFNRVTGDQIKWMVFDSYEEGRRNILCLNTYYAENYQKVQSLECINHVLSHGKKIVSFSCYAKNTNKNTNPNIYDQVSFAIGTNKLWEGQIVTSAAFVDKNPKFSDGDWYLWRCNVALDEGFINSSELWVKLVANVPGSTQSMVSLDDLRIAFQDMATGTAITRTGTEANPGFEIAVKPWCADGGCVSNVSVQLVMDVNGTVFTNQANVAGAITNDISELTTFTASPEVVSAGLMTAMGQSQVRTHDTVKYWAIINYYADSRDPDPAKEWESRFFPDNSTEDAEGRLVTEGEYKVDMDKVEANYKYHLDGDAITLNGDFIFDSERPDRVGFNFRTYDAVGVSNVTVAVSAEGEVDKVVPFVTNEVGVIRFDNEVMVDGLNPNTVYTVTITGKNCNDEEIEQGVFTFTTLPQVIGTPKIVGVDTTSVKVSVSAAAADVVMPAGWTLASAADGVWTFTKNGLTPNAEVTATGIYATNVVGAVSEAVDATPGYTLAAAATKAPVVEKLANKVEVKAGDTDTSGNPAGTEYAVRITTSDGGSVVVTNGTEEIWKPYSEWQNDEAFKFGRPLVDLASTNYFSFLTRNGDGVITTNEVLTSANSTNVCWDMVAAIVDNGAQQQADPFGIVNIDIEFQDFAQSENARAEVQYKVKKGKKGEGSYGEWQTLTNDYLVSFPGEQFTVTNTIAWNAWEATGIDTTDGAYTFVLRAKVTDKAAKTTRASVWSAKTAEDADEFTLDFTKPTVTLTCDEKEVPQVLNDKVKFYIDATADEPISGFEDGDITVTGNATAKIVWHEGNEYQLLVTPTADGTITVQIEAGVVTDAFGNPNVASEVIERTYDNTAPSNLVWKTTEPKTTPTQETAYKFEADAKDLTSTTYHWSIKTNTVDGGFVETALPDTGSEVAGSVGEGTNTISVYVTDAAGNQSATSNLTWIVDTTPPVMGNFTATPAAITKETSFDFSATASDKWTAVTYWWQLDGGESAARSAAPTGASVVFTAGGVDEKALKNGAHTVKVWAVDEAGNASTVTNVCTWKVDTEAPKNLEINGTPKDDAITNDETVSLTASAKDDISDTDDKLTYQWYFNDEAQTAGNALAKTAVEGTNTAYFTVTDEAGNSATSVTNKWIYDKTAPVLKGEISGSPANDAVTKEAAFAYSQSATDNLTAITYHWTMKGAKAEQPTEYAGEEFAGEVTEDDVYTVKVYATDAAGNVSTTNTLVWTHDTTAPTMPVINGTPEDKSETKESGYNWTATATDNLSAITYHWKLEGPGAAVDGTTALPTEAFSGDVSEDGVYTLNVYATDAAGNVSPTNTWKFTYDTTPPTKPTISGTPADEDVTNDPAFSYSAEATDELTAVSYHWTLDDQSGSAQAFEGNATTDGVYTVSVYATDAVGNVSETNSWAWTLDTHIPTNLVVSGTPAEGTFVNVDSYVFNATAMDITELKFIWELKRDGVKIDAVEMVNGKEFNQSAIPETGDGVYTASVYAKDAAGNVSATSNISWTVDTVCPTGTLTSTTASHFSKKAAPMIVKAEFSEFVTNFDASCVEVTNGSVTKIENEDDANKVFTITIMPTRYEVKGIIDQIDVTVAANKVFDKAGNGNDAVATLTRYYDTVNPTVDGFATTAPEYFNDKYNPFTVEVEFSTNVTYFTADSITVNNGTVVVTENEGVNTNLFKFTVTPSAEGEVTVQIPEGAVTNKIGNGNFESDLIKRTYDKTAPELPVISGTPNSTFTNSWAYNFTATAFEANPYTLYWKLEGPDGGRGATALPADEAFKGDVGEDGEYTVSVYAIDAAGNISPTNTFSWTADTIAPVLGESSVSPANGAVTQQKTYEFAQSVTEINAPTNCWTLTKDGAAVGGATALPAAEKFTGSELADGVYTAMVYAVDAAGNVSATTNSWSWTVDNTAPVLGELTGTPDNGAVTTLKTYELNETAEDKNAVSYHWTLNGEVANTTGSKLAGSDLEDGVYEVSVYVTDAAGNVSAVTNSWKWTVDNTAPVLGELTGSPANGAVTTQKTYELNETAEDKNAVSYHWTLNGVPADTTGAKLAGSDLADGVYAVEVYATDAAGNVSATTNSWKWTVDNTAPVLGELTGSPDNGAVTKQQTYELNETAEDANAVSYHWTLNGEVANTTGSKLAGTDLEDGVYEVSVYVTDAAGNVSVATNSWKWTVDNTAPVLNGAITGEPENGKDTKAKSFALTQAVTEINAPTNCWTLTKDGAAVAQGRATLPANEEFAGSDLDDGVYTAMVYSVDAAGNVSATTNSYSWTVDNTAPELKGEITGEPANGKDTKATSFALTQDVEDVNTVTLHWTMTKDGEAFKSEALAKSAAFEGDNLADGVYAVEVYATDAAGNDSATTNTYSWTVDNTAPVLKGAITGEPKNHANTQATNFSLTQTVEDVNTVTLHWSIAKDGAAVGGATALPAGVAFTNETALADGKYVVEVYATDAAGNVSATTNSYNWTVDTIAPVLGELTGEPANGSVTKAKRFTLNQPVTEANGYYLCWKMKKDGSLCYDGSEYMTEEIAYDEDLEDGVYEVIVYAYDNARNRSATTNTWTWTVDATAPVLEGEITGTPAKGVNTTTTSFELSQAVTETHSPTNCWTLTKDGAAVEIGGFVETTLPANEKFKGSDLADGVYTAMVYAVDAAGNDSVKTNSHTWTVDNAAPTSLEIMGTPAEGKVTADATVALVATAEDKLTPAEKLEYQWYLNGEKVGSAGCATEAGFALKATSVEGTNTAYFTVTDLAGNVATSATRTWVLDSKTPTGLTVTGSPADGVYTQNKNFEFVAEAKDATKLTYWWQLDDGECVARSATATGSVAPTGERNWVSEAFANETALIDGEHTVKVYAKDEAGNVGETNTVTWTVDTVAPTVTLTGVSPEDPDKVINIDDGDLVVKVAFSEVVTNFTAGCLTVVNGTISNVTTNEASKIFTVAITPVADGEITVDVNAGVVWDLAGNPNEAAETLKRECDITRPTVTLYSDMFDPFNAVDAEEFYVAVKFSEAVIDFTKDRVSVENCTAELLEPDVTYGDEFTLKVTPKKDGLIKIWIAKDDVEDTAGNGCEASTELTRTYDSTPPTQPVITGDNPTKVKVFKFFAESTDANGIDVYCWVFNGVEYNIRGTNEFTATAIDGANSVSVMARDTAYNWSIESKTITWVYSETSETAFGGGVTLGTDPVTGEAKEIKFENFTCDFSEEGDSTVVITGFASVEETINGLTLWLKVKNDLNSGDTRYVKVDSQATYDSVTGQLTVTVSKQSLFGGGDEADSLFAVGVDNCNLGK